MATLNFHGLINGKNKNLHLLLFHCRYFDKTVLEMFDDWSSTKHILFVQTTLVLQKCLLSGPPPSVSF